VFFISPGVVSICFCRCFTHVLDGTAVRYTDMTALSAPPGRTPRPGMVNARMDCGWWISGLLESRDVWRTG